MGLKKLSEKIADYNDRLERGKAGKIKPDHVRKTLEKLRKKEHALASEMSTAESADAKERLERKLGIAREHIARAEWLLDEIS